MELRQITDLLLEGTRRGLRGQGVTVEFTDAAVDWLAQRGHQPEYGARPLRRTIQREVDNQLSRLLLDGSVRGGDRVTVDTADGNLTFRTGARAGTEPREPEPRQGRPRTQGPGPGAGAAGSRTVSGQEPHVPDGAGSSGRERTRHRNRGRAGPDTKTGPWPGEAPVSGR
ncbi:hypothetical protein ACR6C2_38695 [Streptomyces sp. INA 01156]